MAISIGNSMVSSAICIQQCTREFFKDLKIARVRRTPNHIHNEGQPITVEQYFHVYT
jgi:hypothetical protein